MEDHESSSSTGLVIGIIVGGVVVVMLILGGIFGVAWFFMADAHMAEQAAEEESLQVKAARDDAERLLREVKAARERAEATVHARQDFDTRKRLVGLWDSKAADGSQNTIDLRDDGTLEATMQTGGKTQTASGRWEVLVAKEGDGLQLRRTLKQGPASDEDIRFLDDDRFVMEGPSGGATYQRRREGKP